MAARYLLDTNICLYIAKHNPPAVRERFVRHAASELAMSVITLGELRFGAEKSRSRERALAAIGQLEAVIQVAPLPEAAGEHRTLRPNSCSFAKQRPDYRQQRPLAGSPCSCRRLDIGY